ncbi:transketolase [Filifactor villosus]|uniref:Transketolase n=1 Tax=Filifactor villosus TaxID=29374 RepID=A0ABV9QMK4_9FIRM
MKSYKRLEEHARTMRKNIVKMVTSANSGHPGGSLSGVEILTSLYFEEMNFSKDNYEDPNRDRFVLSKGHASPLLYSALVEKGLIDEAELSTFRKINSRLQGHPNMNYVKGVEMSTGSLGQGLSAAVGMALSAKVHDQSYRVYSLLGDGEIQEGQIWEAAMSAAQFKLDNLVAIVDNNNLQIDGELTEVMSPYPIGEKFSAFGWEVIEADGHNYDELLEAYAKARETKGKPTCIVAKTVKGKGVSYMENQCGWHGNAPSPEQCELAIKELEGDGEHE